MKTLISVVGAVAVAGGALSAVAWAAGPAAPAQPTSAPAQGAAEMHAIANMSEIKWGPQPPSLPPGGQAAVMAGDPAGTGFISIRAKLPAGYTVPPHFHPTDEHVTVLSGAMIFGMGDKIDAKTEKTVKAGGYFTAAANMHHYAIAKGATVIQVDLVGPLEVTYVNPADDPRNKPR